MKVKELMEMLENFDPDDFVFLTLNGATQYFFVDALIGDISGSPIISSNEAPDYDDVHGFAEVCFGEHYKTMTPLKREILKEFIG